MIGSSSFARRWRVNHDDEKFFVVKPSFLGIGAQRCGTTRLHRILDEHPEIVMTKWGVGGFNKEIHYFDRFVMSKTFDWYESHFPKFGISGEITPAYATLNRRCVKAINRYLPEARIFYVLRNPADRIWSQIRMMLSGWLSSEITNMKLESLIRLFDSPAVQLRSNYLQTLNIWTNVFGANQFLALSFDQLIDSDGLPKLLDFLQVSPNWGPTHDASAKILSSPDLKMPQELRWLCAAQFLPMVEQLVNIFPPSLPWLTEMMIDRDSTPSAFLHNVHQIRLQQQLDCHRKWLTSSQRQESLAFALEEKTQIPPS